MYSKPPKEKARRTAHVLITPLFPTLTERHRAPPIPAPLPTASLLATTDDSPFQLLVTSLRPLSSFSRRLLRSHFAPHSPSLLAPTPGATSTCLSLDSHCHLRRFWCKLICCTSCATVQINQQKTVMCASGRRWSVTTGRTTNHRKH